MGGVESSELKRVKELTITVGNKELTVSANDVTPETTLNQYLRDKSLLTGTKAMCLEGGCGSCIVAVTTKHPVTKKTQTFSVNSCLVSIYSCHGWEIHTVEGIGNKLIGFHPIQKQLAKFNGTQCGFCSPGMVMSMFALSEGKSDLTMADVENSFGGNLCRCTGYRPILSAFKAMASDADPALLGTDINDIPDIEEIKLCKKTDAPCTKTCEIPCRQSYSTTGIPQALCFVINNNDRWYKVYMFADVVKLVKQYGSQYYMLVGGNTARGAHRPNHETDIYIDITHVTELITYSSTADELKLGANLPLNETIELFQKMSKDKQNFSYLNQMAEHIKLVANTAVRNIGTIAGNLMLKNQHPDFPSDIFLILETVGAKLTVVNASDNTETTLTLAELVNYDMTMKIIKNVTLSALGSEYIFHSYKIMQRAQNTHAMVNAGFLMKLDASKNVEKATIVYGNITPDFIHATQAENYLKGKPLFDNNSMQGVFDALNQELNPEAVLPEPSPEYRKQLAIALYYKFILYKAPDGVITAQYKSGGRMITLERPISTGLQDYETNKTLYPVTEAIPKVEALAQTSGEAKYVFDRPPAPGQLYAAFVEAKAVPLSIISNVDASEAMKMPGVVAYIDKNDVPGKNTFTPLESGYKTQEEELFCEGKVLYYNQPIGVICATSQELANKAADLVNVTYSSSSEKPYFSPRDLLKDNQTDKVANELFIPPKRTDHDVKHTVKGTYDIYGQYHFSMETQICAVELTEDGYNMFPSTQWTDLCHSAACKAINVQASKIHVEVRRLGGAYGCKISRAALISTACIVAAHKLKKPVRMWMQFERNMDMIGKRCPISADYEVKVNDKGVVQSLHNVMYSNYGANSNEPTAFMSVGSTESGYDTDTWYLSVNHAITQMTANTWCRAPGSCEGSSMIEGIFEHVSLLLGIDPYELRMRNISKKFPDIINLMEELKTWSDYTSRQSAVTEYNKANRWTKKGLSIIPMRFEYLLLGAFNCVISIYWADGSVAVTHSGIEMGQGVNTKVVQVVSYLLGVPMDTVSVKPANTLTNANGMFSGSSLTSESICCATIKVCNELNRRLEPYRKKMENSSWTEQLQAAYLDGINLTANSICFTTNDMKGYDIFGVGVAEVEVDILTGLQQILRLDIIEDVGNSMSPNIDIGQIEGAVVMGLGLWLYETLVYNDKGQLTNNRTWNYTPPGAKDIPIDFRIRIEKNKPNPVGVFKTKAVTEPPLLLSFSVPLAIRRAMASARTDSVPDAKKWVPINGVTSPEFTFINCLNDYEQYKL